MPIHIRAEPGDYAGDPRGAGMPLRSHRVRRGCGSAWLGSLTQGFACDALRWMTGFARHPLAATIHAVSDAIEPSLDQILDFCAEDPVERVFLEDVARRRLGRFTAF